MPPPDDVASDQLVPPFVHAAEIFFRVVGLALVPFVLVIHNGVIARQEAYLDRKFGDVYRSYRARVRRWV